MVKRKTVKMTGTLPEISDDVKRELDNLDNYEITYDEDCPELTKEQLRQLAIEARNVRQNKQVIAVRISPETLAKAKAVGKGYTGFLSRLIDYAINDPVLVKKALRKK